MKLTKKDIKRIKLNEKLVKELFNKNTKENRTAYIPYLAIRCLGRGIISRGKFAEIMGIDRCEIDDFIAEKKRKGKENYALGNGRTILG